jgi:hypothetical protein
VKNPIAGNDYSVTKAFSYCKNVKFQVLASINFEKMAKEIYNFTSSDLYNN